MHLWGISSWVDPGAEYYVWDGCCVFALVFHHGFADVHIAMNRIRWRECRKAGADFLDEFGRNKLRAVILPDRPHICNYAKKMGFGPPETKTIQTAEGSLSPFFVMWREPGEYYGRRN